MASPNRVTRGALIVIEGLDRSGKTKQVQRLAAELSQRGRNHVRTLRFPDRTTPIGQIINSYLQSESSLEDHVIHLLFSANRWEFTKSIEDGIAAGHTIICDRYTYSGMIYSAAKRNPNLTLGWAREPDVGLPRPDLVIFLDLSPDVTQKRGGFGDERYEKREMQGEVRRLFQSLADSHEEEADDIILVDAGGTVEEVGEKILCAVLRILATVEAGSLGEQIRRIGRWERDDDKAETKTSFPLAR